MKKFLDFITLIYMIASFTIINDLIQDKGKLKKQLHDETYRADKYEYLFHKCRSLLKKS